MQHLDELAARFEQASRNYAAANNIERDDDWFVLKMQEELGELTQMWIKLSGRGRRRGMDETALRRELTDETADLFGHLLLFIRRHDLKMADAIKRKWRFDPEAPSAE